MNQQPWNTDTSSHPSDGIEVVTNFEAPDGTKGRVIRAFHRGTFVFKSAFLNDAPKWIRHGGVELDPKRGTPTIAYLTMRQMHLLGIRSGGCKAFEMRGVQDVRTIALLARLRRDGVEIGEAIQQTPSFLYADTIIVQSGHVLHAVSVTGGCVTPFHELLDFYESRRPVLVERHRALLEEAGIAREDKVYVNFDIHFKVSARTT